MAQAELHLSATAHVKLAKYDENGNLIGIEESDINLTEEEANAIWQSQPQE